MGRIAGLCDDAADWHWVATPKLYRDIPLPGVRAANAADCGIMTSNMRIDFITGKGGGQMKIIVHYPKNKKDIETLQKKVAIIHAEAVVRHIEKLPCPTSQKIALLTAIKKGSQE